MLADLRKQVEILIEKSLGQFSILNDPPPKVFLETPDDKNHGEFSCNVALQLARTLKRNPLEIAHAIKASLEKDISQDSLKEKIKLVEVKNPGFINFFLTEKAFYEILYEIFKKRDDYGRSKVGAHVKTQIEFVSANPTGPLSVAHARQATVGDALANILRFAGFDVKKEFYVNDEGNQIDILGQSIFDRAREILTEAVDFPETNYQGEYIKDMARLFLEKERIKDLESLKKIERKEFSRYGVDYLLDVIKTELKDFGVGFDVWSFQSRIATDKKIEKVIDFLRKKGFIYDREGAVWFKSTTLGDDKDRVIKKSDGSFTYLAPDIVYHQDKFERGFKRVINIWGPDHHGYIPRLKAAVAALGESPEALVILVVQLATIYKEGKPLSMSTRRGQYISLRDVMEEVGVDAARIFFLLRHISAHLDFDLELAKKETPENPVYYIQYAHARCHSILEFAKGSSLKPKYSSMMRLTNEEELGLIKKLGGFPDVVNMCVRHLDPYALASYLLELATGFHKFYDRHRVVGEDRELSSERLALIEAVKTVLGNGLRLIGVSAPTKM